MNNKTERTLQLIVAMILILLAVGLWNDNRNQQIIVGVVLLMIGRALIMIFRNG